MDRIARALLAAADGGANTRIAADLGVTVVSVRAWRARFESEGLGGFQVGPDLMSILKRRRPRR